MSREDAMFAIMLIVMPAMVPALVLTVIVTAIPVVYFEMTPRDVVVTFMAMWVLCYVLKIALGVFLALKRAHIVISIESRR